MRRFFDFLRRKKSSENGLRVLRTDLLSDDSLSDDVIKTTDRWIIEIDVQNGSGSTQTLYRNLIRLTRVHGVPVENISFHVKGEGEKGRAIVEQLVSNGYRNITAASSKRDDVGVRGGVLFETFHIAGMQYRLGDDEKLWGRLREGDALVLVAEPDNEHDENAVAIYYGAEGRKIGYVPRVVNRGISVLLKAGHKEILEARIKSVDLSVHPGDRVEAEVYIVKSALNGNREG